MSILDSMYTPPPAYDEVDELELALQEAYEAGISDGYDYALDEGFMDKLKAAGGKIKSWAQRNPRLSRLAMAGAISAGAHALHSKIAGRSLRDDIRNFVNKGFNKQYAARLGTSAAASGLAGFLHNKLMNN